LLNVEIKLMLHTSFVYREHSPSAPALDAVWTIDVRVGYSWPSPYLTLPDGCVDLIYRLRRDCSGKVDSAGLVVAGPTDRPSTYFPYAGEEFIGIRFAPGWGGGALGVAASELVGRLVVGAELSKQLLVLEKNLFACNSKQEAVRLLSSTAEIWASERSPDRRTLEAVNALRLSGGQLRIEQAAQLAGVSSRTFRRDVKEFAGLSPKTLSRIFRFRQALSRIEFERGLPLRELALHAGYADQAHMTREFRALGGFTPSSEPDYSGKSNLVDETCK
jgi:AraC-like DNA-binding protein